MQGLPLTLTFVTLLSAVALSSAQILPPPRNAGVRVVNPPPPFPVIRNPLPAPPPAFPLQAQPIPAGPPLLPAQPFSVAPPLLPTLAQPFPVGAPLPPLPAQPLPAGPQPLTVGSQPTRTQPGPQSTRTQTRPAHSLSTIAISAEADLVFDLQTYLENPHLPVPEAIRTRCGAKFNVFNDAADAEAAGVNVTNLIGGELSFEDGDSSTSGPPARATGVASRLRRRQDYDPDVVEETIDLIEEIVRTDQEAASLAELELRAFVNHGLEIFQGLISLNDTRAGITLECLPCIGTLSSAVGCVDQVIEEGVLTVFGDCDVYGRDVCICTNCIQISELNDLCDARPVVLPPGLTASAQVQDEGPTNTLLSNVPRRTGAANRGALYSNSTTTTAAEDMTMTSGFASDSTST